MIFGLRVRTPRPMPLLAPWAGPEAEAPVDVVFGPVPHLSEPPVLSSPLVEIYRDGSAFVRPPDGPRILVQAGRRMVVETSEPSPAVLHTWLFNFAIGLLCHQRGMTPLHGAVMEKDGRAVVLAGVGGSGKSTTSWALMRRGWRLMSDDLAVIEPDTLMVRPACPSLKLWQGAAMPEMQAALRVLPGRDKYFLPVPESFCAVPTPLALVLTLMPQRNGDRPQALPVAPLTAAIRLQAHVWGRRHGVILDGGRSAFALTTAVARAVPCMELARPDDLGSLDALCDLIESLILASTARQDGGCP